MTTQTDSRRVRVLASLRLSNDPEGKKASPRTQRRKIIDLVQREGWPPVADEDWFIDRDKSAYKEDVVRTEWQRLLETVEEIDGRTTLVIVVGYNQDRFTRQLADPQKIADLIDRKNGQLWSAKQGQIAVKLGARTPFYVQGAVAAGESEAVMARTLDGIETAAMEGRAHGRVAYGWKRIYEADERGKLVSREVIDEPVRDAMLDAAKRVLALKPMDGICADLNARGIAAPGAGHVLLRDDATREPLEFAASTWNRTKLIQVLLRKRNIGVRVHRRNEGTPEETVTEYKGAWPPLMEREMYDDLVELLRDPKRKKPPTNKAVHLVSGIGVCGVCGEQVKGQRIWNKAKDGYRVVYRCTSAHVMKSKERTDDVVEQAVVEVLTAMMLKAPEQSEDDEELATARRRLATANRKLVELAADYDDEDNEWSVGEYRQRVARQEANRDAAQAVIASRSRRRMWASVLDGVLDDGDVYRVWDSLTLIGKRTLLAEAVTITLMPSSRRGRAAFDPETVIVRPRDEQAQ